jgi:lactate 2-monooxygenase
VYSYVAYGAGDGNTQHANVEAFSRYGIVPRMLVGATERDLSVSLFDMQLSNPLFMPPVGVLGVCAQDFHRDIQAAQASAQTGLPMVRLSTSPR